jgi:hypothetical protein
MVLATVIVKNAIGLILVAVPMVCLSIRFEWVQFFGFAFLFILAGFVRSFSERPRMLHFYVLIYLGLHLIWPYTTYDRFLVPLLPFLLLFLLTEMRFMTIRLQRAVESPTTPGERYGSLVVGVCICIIVSLIAYSYTAGIRLAIASFTNGAREQPEKTDLIRWIEANTAASDVLVCEQDPIYFLYTGRKATRSSPLGEGAAVIELDRTEIDRRISMIIHDNKARYLILFRTYGEGADQIDGYQKAYESMVGGNPQIFIPVFQSADGRGTIYRIEMLSGS